MTTTTPKSLGCWFSGEPYLLADFECSHGRLPDDTTDACGCWEGIEKAHPGKRLAPAAKPLAKRRRWGQGPGAKATRGRLKATNVYRCKKCGTSIEQKPGRGRPRTTCEGGCAEVRGMKWAA